MTKPIQTPKSFLNTLLIIHYALLLSVLVFGAIAYFRIKNHVLDFENTDTLFLSVVIALSLFGIVGGKIIFGNLLKTATTKTILREKLGVYQTASLIKFATIEGPALFAIVCYLNTGQFLFLLIALALALYYVSLKPTKEKISKTLQLNREHQMEFNRDNQELN